MVWKRKLFASLGIVALAFSMAQPASARLIFQNDTEFEMEADNLVIDSDANTDATEIYVKFGNSGTASENGLITWDIANEKFVIDNDLDLNGTTTITGELDASGATSVRLREVADVQDGVTNCTYANEVAVDTGEGALYICTAAAPTNTWTKASADPVVNSGAVDPTCDAAATGDLFYNTTDAELKYCDGSAWQTVGPQDFEQVFAADADKTLTTGDQTFTIDSGTGNFDVTNSGEINFTTGVFDVDATTLTVDAATQTFTGTNISFDSGNWDITTGGVATFTTTNTGDLTATGDVDFSTATSVRTREVADIDTAACTVVGDIVLDTSTNKLYTCTAVGTPGTFKSLGGSQVEQLEFNPEYPDSVIDAATGTGANKGTLQALFDNVTNRQYYSWTSTKAPLQDLNIKFKFTLPDDFQSFGDLTVDYQTNTGTNTDNNVDVTIRDITTLGSPVTCSTTSGLASATWATSTTAGATLTTGCATATAGSVIEVTLNLAATNGGDFARVGQVKLNYTN